MDRPTYAVHISASRHMPERARIAAQLAAANNAHLIGVSSTLLPETPYMAGIGSEAASLLASYLERARAKVAADLAVFERIAAGADVSSYEKHILNDDAAAALCLQGRYSDLLIVGQADLDDPDEPDNLAEYVLMNSGRPVLICPHSVRPDTVGKRCLIAWDGGIEAARAITSALPLLRKADSVLLSVVDPRIGADAHGQEPGADMALYLARHGVKLNLTRTTTSDKMDVGAALLSQAASVAADLLVMGGYGHSRFREVVLGGVTETILRAMTLPVLMTH